MPVINASEGYGLKVLHRGQDLSRVRTWAFAIKERLKIKLSVVQELELRTPVCWWNANMISAEPDKVNLSSFP